MKKNDIVKITELTDELQKLNLQLDFYGIVISSNFDYSEVMFFNANNIGESTICKASNKIIKKEDIELPKSIIKEISDGKEELKISYKSDISDSFSKRADIEDEYRRIFTDGIEKEKIVGSSLYGVHRLRLLYFQVQEVFP